MQGRKPFPISARLLPVRARMIDVLPDWALPKQPEDRDGQFAADPLQALLELRLADLGSPELPPEVPKSNSAAISWTPHSNGPDRQLPGPLPPSGNVAGMAESVRMGGELPDDSPQGPQEDASGGKAISKTGRRRIGA